MGRPNDECWSHVTKVKDTNKWKCRYCKREYSGGATRIKIHLGLGPPKATRKDIRKCSHYPVIEGVSNNMASTSRNPHTIDEGI
jgi:hypothetical protein